MGKKFRHMLSGAKTVLNLFPAHDPQFIEPLYKKSRTDIDALCSDWEIVGMHMRNAMNEIGSHVKQARP